MYIVDSPFQRGLFNFIWGYLHKMPTMFTKFCPIPDEPSRKPNRPAPQIIAQALQGLQARLSRTYRQGGRGWGEGGNRHCFRRYRNRDSQAMSSPVIPLLGSGDGA